MNELEGDEDAVLERVRGQIRQDLRFDYLVTGSWSLKASQEAALLLEPLWNDLVSVAVDARNGNGGKFGIIPEESSCNLTKPTYKGESSALTTSPSTRLSFLGFRSVSTRVMISLLWPLLI